MTLYGYARDPSAPEPEPSSAHVPQPRSGPDDLWEDSGSVSFGTGSTDYGSFGTSSSATSSFDSSSAGRDSFDSSSAGRDSFDDFGTGYTFASGSVDGGSFEASSFEPVSFGSAGVESTSPAAPFPSGSFASASFPSLDDDPLGAAPRTEPPAPPPESPAPRSEEPPATVTARASVPVIASRPPAIDPVPVQPGPTPVSAVPAAAPVAPASASDEAELRAAAIAWADQNIESDGPDIQPWDRRPLFVVLAAAAALVLVAVISGVASANLFRPDPAEWQAPGGAGTSAPSPGASGGAAGAPVTSDTITMSGVGDVIMGTQYRGGGGKLPPNDGQGFFDPVKSSLASDLVMGNLETPLSVDTGAGKCAPDATECFQFFLPPSYANHLKDGGFQVMNLANNHTRDMGTAGLANTRTALEAAGVKPTGAPGEITIVDVKGVKVAVLGFSVYSWGNSLNNISTATALVKSAASQADLVVIQMQGGAEGADKTHVVPGHEFFAGEDRGDLIAFSHAVIDAGADVVFGHGPHIMRGMEFYKGRLIAYSLGNFCGYGTLNSAGFLGVGGILKVTLHRDGSWAGGTLVSTQMVRGGMVDLDPNKRALAFVQGLSNTDFGATAARISPTDGAISPPAA